MNDSKLTEPNTLRHSDLKLHVSKGFHVEVVAAKDAQKVKSFWYGVWFIRVVSPDRSFEKLVVSPRSHNKVSRKEFKTANGVISYMHECGFDSCRIPLREGGIEIHKTNNT